ncbi:MAG: gamma-glutamyltransferase [Proteobacteria bacterium]|nr:gamma-glutamyltransferase [Pseudomonadota bacterium]
MMRNLRIVLLAVAVVLLSLNLSAQTQGTDVIRYGDVRHPIYDKEGMVVSSNILASEIGARVLADGGTAVDAAVAVGFALAVVRPRSGNIGGGGFMLVYSAADGRTKAIDYREVAPVGATRDMFLDTNGNVDVQRARFSHLSAGVPGTVAGLHLAHSKYGKLPWERLLAPAIELARNGIKVSYDMSHALQRTRDRFSRDISSLEYFFKENGEAYLPGERLVQADLAWSLEQIAEHGPDAFYHGEIAKKIIAEMKKGGGLIDAESLATYQPIVRDPVRGTYRGYDIVSMPPSSSGGIHVIQMLNILEHFPVREYGAESADNVHLLVEVAKLAFADRSKHLGDADFYDVPSNWLTSKEYARELAAGIDMHKARPSEDIAPGVAPEKESVDTTHFSIIDRDGNMVANTYTLNLSFGSGMSVAGAGFILNNEMDDFSSKPGTANAYGLIGGVANSIEAGKRPLSSMTPTMLFKDGRPVLATGSPGGSRIITSVLQMIVNVIDHEMNISVASSAPRMHHQWLPDVIQLESGFSPDTIRELQRRGHTIRGAGFTIGNVHSVARQNGYFVGAADPRRPGSGSAGPTTLRD